MEKSPSTGRTFRMISCERNKNDANNTEIGFEYCFVRGLKNPGGFLWILHIFFLGNKILTEYKFESIK